MINNINKKSFPTLQTTCKGNVNIVFTYINKKLHNINFAVN